MNFSYFLPFITFGLGVLTQAWTGGRKAHETSITDHIADIAALRVAATEYWLSAGTDDPEQVVIESAKIQIALAAVMAFREVAPNFFSQLEIENYSTLVRDLHRTVTGGEFETAGRSASPAVAVDVARQCASLTHYLRNSRSNIYGLSLRRRYEKVSTKAPAVWAGAQVHAKNGRAWIYKKCSRR